LLRVGEGTVFSALLLVFSISISLPSQTPQSGTNLPKAPLLHKVELLNGLRLVTLQTSGAGKIALNLLVKAGSTLDPPQRRGTAYLVAQSLRLANEREVLEHLSEEMDDLGAALEINVDQDSTVFKAQVPTNNLESFLDLLSHMVLRPLFQSDRMEKLKQQIIAAKIASLEPTELAKEKLHNLVFGEHPYGKPIHGDLQSLANVRTQDLDEFHKAYYSPNNAVLVVVGDLETSQIEKLVREKLGGWVKGAKVEVEFREMPTKETFSMLIVKDNQEEAVVAFGHTGPPRATPDYYAVTIMNLILGGLGDRSRLAQDFLAKGIVHRVLESEFQFAYLGGLFQVITVIPSNLATPALETIMKAIEALKSSPIRESELVAAKETLLGRYAEILNSPSLVADQATSMELYALASDFLVSFPKRVQEVTTERVEEVSKNYLSTSRAVAVLVGAGDSSIPELQRLGTASITERSSSHQ
jgi:zinc protease